jgi:cysteinyl-tRNA synthetase
MLMLCNSMTRKLEEFKPLKNKTVTMYTCGPSIYQMPHIGNYRTFLYEDILLRYLEYLGYDVNRTLFITDIEDKAISEANKENIPLNELTQENTEAFIDELKKLGAKMPEQIARPSTSVDQAVEMIETLLKKGYAYWHKDNVYYDPLKFKDFGRLYRLDMKRWPKKRKRFHKDTYPGNRWNLGDFILWHGSREGEVYFDTRIGKGRPAWNIQDPAMALQTQGLRADIYCGGVDNMIRHHDYVIAITEAITGKAFARFWLHGEHLFVDGKKMSKSRDNIIYPKDLLDRGCAWQHIRFFLINGYYRKRLNFTFSKFAKACEKLRVFKDIVSELQESRSTSSKSNPAVKSLIAKMRKDFELNVNNDLHVKDAFDSLFTTVSRLAFYGKKGRVTAAEAEQAVDILKSVDQVLQIIF